MKERPILFSDPMVRAILDGRKTQTRRVVKRVPCSCGDWLPEEVCATTAEGWQTGGHSGRWWCGSCGVCDDGVNCPYGVPGDRLWVREAWWLINAQSDQGVHEVCVAYDADGEALPNRPLIQVSRDEYEKWANRLFRGPHKRPSIHMPRWASRILLEVTGVRVERLREIENSEADALAEGWSMESGRAPWPWFRNLWDEINGDGAYAANPWVWVVGFRRLP